MDQDDDGIRDADDNSVTTPNTDQADADGDGVGDAWDTSPPGPDPDPLQEAGFDRAFT
jgi:hypothetical protein